MTISKWRTRRSIGANVLQKDQKGCSFEIECKYNVDIFDKPIFYSELIENKRIRQVKRSNRKAFHNYERSCKRKE